MRIHAVLISLILLSGIKFSQAQTSDSSNSKFLRVYLDGVSYYQDHIKTEIAFVNYMRDRYDAQVHLLITSQTTGSGGSDFTIFFIGQNEFDGKNDTLHYISNTNNTEEEIRDGLIQILKMGLMAYVAKLPVVTPVIINFTSDTSVIEEKQAEDKWDGWVYSLNSYENINLSKYYKSFSISGSVNASKVTDEWKLYLFSGLNYNTDNFDFGDGFVNEYKTNSKYISAGMVNSLDKHWSVGGEANYFTSTYSNYDLALAVAPAIEYDVFPYSESTRKLFTFYYAIGPKYNIYTDTTIYNKTKELLFQESLEISLSLTQKWGSAIVGLNGSNYLDDFSKNSFGFYTSLSWRVFEGFSINSYVMLNFIHDQVSLPKGDVSEDEILLQITELQTNFNFYTFFGISYTFGSIYNNIVNPRFYTLNNL